MNVRETAKSGKSPCILLRIPPFEKKVLIFCRKIAGSLSAFRYKSFWVMKSCSAQLRTFHPIPNPTRKRANLRSTSVRYLVLQSNGSGAAGGAPRLRAVAAPRLIDPEGHTTQQTWRQLVPRLPAAHRPHSTRLSSIAHRLCAPTHAYRQPLRAHAPINEPS